MTTEDEPRDTSEENRRGWNFGTPPLRSRALALLKVLSPDQNSEMQSAIAARPKREPRWKSGFVFLEIYKIWYVLHHDKLGDERTTNIYIRKISDDGIASVEDVNESAISAYLLPLDHHDWLSQYAELGEQEASK